MRVPESAPRAEVSAAAPRSGWRRALCIGGRIVVALVAPLLAWGLAALVLPRIVCHRDWRPPSSGIAIGIVSNGVHTDFVLPARAAGIDWTQRMPYSWFDAADARCEWIGFGWGDRGFYLDTPTFADLDLGTAFTAVSGRGAAAMHVTWRHAEPTSGAGARRLVLTEEQYRALVDYVLASFRVDAAGAPLRIDHAGYTPCDRFFEATGSYSAIVTCNEWTGAGLRRIGVRCGWWTPLAADVLRPLPE